MKSLIAAAVAMFGLGGCIAVPGPYGHDVYYSAPAVGVAVYPDTATTMATGITIVATAEGISRELQLPGCGLPKRGAGRVTSGRAMGEADLTEIEGRLDLYPPQARQDILRLTGELRRLYQSPEPLRKTTVSPLYDALTGLLNAGAYGVRFAMARARATRYHKIFAVMSVDLDFAAQAPAQDDREGTVKAVAERLGCCVRATDTLARIGDESFAILLEDLTQPGHAERVQQNVKDALAQPMQVGDEALVPAVAVQLRFYPVAEHETPLH